MTDVSVTSRPPCWYPSGWAPTWRLYTKLYKFGSNTFPNNAQLKNRRDLFLGEDVYISIIYHLPARTFTLIIEWLRFLVLIT